ncbi:MAG TPA: ankyrin repeat domain-containing protein [Candidatus Acidoferrum sp.]|nr:ankyrin repeat domain-containing protein [Candidatus Acidoferrum sp.]
MNDEFRQAIERGDVIAVRLALEADSSLANSTIHWVVNQENQSDPLHYVSDCVFNGWLFNGNEGEIAQLLLDHGAALDGSHGRETPLIGAASLGAEKVAKVLIDAGADLEATSVFGARALHWAAWMGLRSTVELLIARGARIDVCDTEFASTPLYWAVHGYSPQGPREKRDQIGAAKILIDAGASVAVTNKRGLSALDLAKDCANPGMYQLLQQHS